MGIATTTIGFGPGFDEQMLTAMAEAGGGNFVYADQPRALARLFAREAEEQACVVVRAPTLHLTLQPGMSGSLLNFFPVRLDRETMAIDLRDMVDGEEIVLVFEVTVPAGGENSTVALTGSLRLGDGQIVDVPIPPLLRRPAFEVVQQPPAVGVTQKHAVEKSSRMRREAIDLDRQGDIRRSRDVLHQARQALAAAPASVETAMLQEDISNLIVQQDRFSEDTRKRVAQDVHSRSRGRRTQ